MQEIYYVNYSDLVYAFNRWMEDYTKDPDGFEDIHNTALKFMNERLDGDVPTYGDGAASFLLEYIAERKTI